MPGCSRNVFTVEHTNVISNEEDRKHMTGQLNVQFYNVEHTNRTNDVHHCQ